MSSGGGDYGAWRAELAYDYSEDAHHRNWALLERCESMLADLEFGEGGCSVMCTSAGHAPSCLLAALLADLRKELGK